MNWGSTIHEIVVVLQTKLPFNVSEVVKGGSLGHGTAVPGKSDLDLVLYSNDISPDSVVKDGVDRYINEIDQILKSAFKRRYQLDKKTPFALQFTLSTVHGDLEVDLLPSPYWSSASEYIRYMSRLSPPQRRKFQCCEAKWEKYFFQAQRNEVKEYIKRIKVWRDTCWPSSVPGTGRPKSFLLNLLIVEGYRRVGRKADPVAITTEVKKMVKEHRTLSIHWVGDGAQYDGHYIHQARVPFILDPANPFNNVYKSGVHPYNADNIREDRYSEGDGNWTNMVRYIDSLDLTKPV